MTAAPWSVGNRSRFRQVLPGLIPPVVAIVLWWIVSSLGLVPRFVLPPPQDVARAFVTAFTQGNALGHAAQSVFRLTAGFIIGAAGGVAVGLLVGRNARADRFLRAPIAFFQSIGGIAWIPLAIVWFGLGTPAVVFVVANITFFVMLQATILGVRSVSRTMEQMVRTLGGSSFAVLRHVVLPGALVSALTGVRIGLAYGWRALIAAELIVASNGLGFFTLQASSRLETATVMAAVLVIGLLWIAIDRTLLDALERRTVRRWGMVGVGRSGRR